MKPVFTKMLHIFIFIFISQGFLIRAAPYEPLVYRAMKSQDFFSGFLLGFSETVLPIKKNKMQNISVYSLYSASNTNSSKALIF